MPKMKLYVWPKVVALSQYDDGIAFALAPDKKSAVDAVLKKFKKESRYWQDDYARLAKELEETEPLIVENIEGFWVYGSD